MHTPGTAVTPPRTVTRNSVAPSAWDGPALKMVLTYSMVVPGVADAGPTSVIATSASRPVSTVLEALLLAGSGSVVPAGDRRACGVLTSDPRAGGRAETGCHERRASAGAGDRPSRRSCPSPDGDAHAEPQLAVHVHVTPVNGTGNASVTEAPTAALGPLLATVIVHVNGAPAATAGALGVFVTETSATIAAVSVALATSFAAFGSTGALDWRVAVLTSGAGLP